MRTDERSRFAGRDVVRPQVLFACGIVACLLLALGRVVALPVSLLAAELFATILGLFVFGSFKYQIHKNALTYGMALVIVATFAGLETSAWHRAIAGTGSWAWIGQHVLSFHGLDELIHADTMLFILGLTSLSPSSRRRACSKASRSSCCGSTASRSFRRSSP